MLVEKSFPSKYTVDVIRKDLEAGKYTLNDIATYFGDADEDVHLNVNCLFSIILSFEDPIITS